MALNISESFDGDWHDVSFADFPCFILLNLDKSENFLLVPSCFFIFYFIRGFTDPVFDLILDPNLRSVALFWRKV